MPRLPAIRKRQVELEPGGLTVPSAQIIEDYRSAHQSRLMSLMGTREVRTARATFGIFGDGKEVAEVAMAREFRPGDFRAGYYRDQTLMLATGMSDLTKLFAQLYADPDPAHEPASGGRQMTSHFATRLLDESGEFKELIKLRNSSSDVSPTGGQMARLLGLAYASKLYRQEPALAEGSGRFSINGNEVAFGTIGNAGTSQGLFFETVNAAGVLQVPMALSVWDDEYGISVPNRYQTTKSSISEALRGFEWDHKTGTGIDIYVIKGWDYPACRIAYHEGISKVRRTHIPALFHVVEMTQPQGHSTSGSHERYKSRSRLQFEHDFDPVDRMRQWIESLSLLSADDLDELEAEDERLVRACRREALEGLVQPIREEMDTARSLIGELALQMGSPPKLQALLGSLSSSDQINRRLVHSSVVQALIASRGDRSDARDALKAFKDSYERENDRRFNSHLYSESNQSPLRVGHRPPGYSRTSELVDAREVLQRCFDHHLKKDARIFIVGEDVGKLGDVNLVFQGLNEKYGELRVTDTGVREATILGQGIGAALRGLRPIVDIQYLDYLTCALQVMVDDLSTLHYRTAGGQKAPVVIRTKGHRLEGIWHTGSPMSMILSSCRGIYLAVPRDMTRAAGFYNTLLNSDNPGIVVEVLCRYRDKERVPDNVGTFTVPLGMPEIIRPGRDLTLVTYGECCNVAIQAALTLAELGVDIEVIDVQCLNPFDLNHTIVESLAKTNAVVFFDEDVPGGASAYMMQQVLEVQQGWGLLDAEPRTLCGLENRSAFGVDGGYFTKPTADDVVVACYELAAERRPSNLKPLI
ncbi:MAG: thiamine pyrophosphate-dependent enzyme [Actinomycetota bacterium]